MVTTSNFWPGHAGGPARAGKWGNGPGLSPAGPWLPSDDAPAPRVQDRAVPSGFDLQPQKSPWQDAAQHASSHLEHALPNSCPPGASGAHWGTAQAWGQGQNLLCRGEES
jgi:hypothetical protein